MANLAKNILIEMVRLYKRFISPLLPGACRFYPTCSDYMQEAIAVHGFRGLGMGLRRIIRCNPMHPGGIDHVPGTQHHCCAHSANNGKQSLN